MTYHLLAAKLQAPYRAKDFSKYREELEREANAQIPHKEADAATKARLHELVAASKEKYAADERMLGVNWFCPERNMH